MKVLLTGSTGLIGRYVLDLLLKSSHSINLIVRDPLKLKSLMSNTIEMENDKLKIFQGSIENPELLKSAVRGCDVVIHLAALVCSSTKNPRKFHDINLSATSKLLEASLNNKVGKFIFASSLSACVFNNSEIADEAMIRTPDKFFCEYAESKALAEKEVIKYSERGLRYIIFYPTRVFGIGPLNDANGAAKSVYLYMKNRLPFLIDNGNQFSNWSFAGDIAIGILHAAESDKTNEQYIFGGENKTQGEVYDFADNITDKEHLRINISRKWALSVATALDLPSKLIGRRPLITREWLDFVLQSQKISCAKAVNEIGYRITPFEEAMGKTIKWLSEEFINKRSFK